MKKYTMLPPIAGELCPPVKHYYASGQRIATRVVAELYYLLGDHLGSTMVMADEQGNEVGHVVFDPYGEVLTSTLLKIVGGKVEGKYVGETLGQFLRRKWQEWRRMG